MAETDGIKDSERVSFKTKFAYGITSIGSSAVSGVFATSLIIFYREKLLLSEIYIIWAFALYAIWNAINDPLFGWLSDKTKTRWGRRIPYLIVFAPIMAISFVLVWLCPPKTQIGETAVFLWMLMSMLLYDTAFTAALLVYSALGQELSMDHRERASIQVYSMVLGILGTFASMLLPLAFISEKGRQGFINLAIILAILQLITMWITAFTVKERLEFSRTEEPLSFIKSLKETVKNRSFLVTVAMNFCMIFVSSVLLGNLFFYIFYAFQGYPTIVVLATIILSLFGGIIFGVFYILRVNASKGLKAALMQSLVFLGSGLIIVGLLPGLTAAIGFFVAGIGLFGVLSLINAAFGEVADDDEVKTGNRREAAIFGVNAFLTKPAQSVAGVFIAFVLLAFRYREPVDGVQQAQSDFMILGIKLAIGVIPGLVILCAALIFTLYPLHGEYLNEIKTKMYQMHDEKKEKYLSSSQKPRAVNSTDSVK